MERQFIYGNRNVPSTIVVMMYGERELGACRKKSNNKTGKKDNIFRHRLLFHHVDDDEH